MQPTTKVPEAASLRSRLFGKSYEMYAQAAGITSTNGKQKQNSAALTSVGSSCVSVCL